MLLSFILKSNGSAFIIIGITKTSSLYFNFIVYSPIANLIVLIPNKILHLLFSIGFANSSNSLTIFFPSGDITSI